MSKHGIFGTCISAFPFLPSHPIDLYYGVLGASSPIDLYSKQHKKNLPIFFGLLNSDFSLDFTIL
jgi:hypothetical protein